MGIMNSFQGETLSWDQKHGIIELALNRPRANEIGPAALAEVQKFVAAFESDTWEASALIIYGQLIPASAPEETYAKRAAGIRVLIELSHSIFNAIDTAPVVTGLTGAQETLSCPT